ncbi:hypothetical protein CCP3SC1AL1_3690002 [Gammaproteobacteria bacterium]
MVSSTISPMSKGVDGAGVRVKLRTLMLILIRRSKRIVDEIMQD